MWGMGTGECHSKYADGQFLQGFNSVAAWPRLKEEQTNLMTPS